jgi:hypothetical protein
VIVAASRLVAKLLLRRIAVGSLVVVEPGARRRFGTGAPTATVEIRSQRVWRMLMRGITSVYLQGIDSSEIISTVHGRPSPTISATAGLQLRR